MFAVSLFWVIILTDSTFLASASISSMVFGKLFPNVSEMKYESTAANKDKLPKIMYGNSSKVYLP